jgi:hypothetical protein
MLPSPAAFAAGLSWLSRRRNLALFAREADLAELLHEASVHASGTLADEPSAIFFACARRGRVLGPVAALAIPLVAREQARAVGFELDANDAELAVLRLRIVKQAIEFGELKDWFAARQRPLPRP